MDRSGDWDDYGYSSDGDQYCSAASAGFGTPGSSFSLAFPDPPPLHLLLPQHSDGSCADLDASGDSDGSVDGTAVRALPIGDGHQRSLSHRGGLVMGPSTALGSDDWDDFVEQIDDGDSCLPPFYLHEDHPAWSWHNGQHLKEGEEVPNISQSMNATVIDKNESRTAAENGDGDGLKEISCSTQPCRSTTELVFEVAAAGSDTGVGVQLASDSVSDGFVEETSKKKDISEGISDVSSEVQAFQIAASLPSEAAVVSTSPAEESIIPGKVHDLYTDMVSEMEEILLDGREFQRNQFSVNSYYNSSPPLFQFRDGSATASTSGTNDVYPLTPHPLSIEWVEVVGAKQRKGDVSFGERMVGVKEYTVYILRVYGGDDQWDVERRYREFAALHRQLDAIFSAHGLSLPSPWHKVESESRKMFGNASPNVVGERSNLIQDCLRSILTFHYPFEIPKCLIVFLSTGKPVEKSGIINSYLSQQLQKFGDSWNSRNSDKMDSEQISSMGLKVSLVVEMKPQKTYRHMLELQHYKCAGCHKHLDIGSTLLSELVQTIGWNRPRLCAYTGMLFCTTCHSNDNFVLPARVLHLWDFSLYPVSQPAKAYLESIYDQPMLCVSAVNPVLFSKVPILHHVMDIRKKIASMLLCIRCPYRLSIHKGIRVRKYLLESNDFFALHDLVDISKGAFAALPTMMETLCNKIHEHITQQCLLCYDVGEPCAARQACDDPLALIFPFQESEAAKCGSCGSFFHKGCFEKLDICSCGNLLRRPSKRIAAAQQPRDGNDQKELTEQQGSSSSSFFSNILSNARPDKLWKPKNRSPVILMGSLPTTS